MKYLLITKLKSLRTVRYWCHPSSINSIEDSYLIYQKKKKNKLFSGLWPHIILNEGAFSLLERDNLS